MMHTKEAIAEIDEKIREMSRVLDQLKSQRERMIKENNKVKLAIHQIRKIRAARLAAEEKGE
jgi:regulator of replication initiation timing